MGWLSTVNRILMILWIPLLALWMIHWMQPAEVLQWTAFDQDAKSLPRGSFTQDAEAYQAIDEPIFRLNFSPSTMQLPDLRQYLSYYGRNGRPDTGADHQAVHIGLKGLGRNRDYQTVSPGARVYLKYQQQAQMPRGEYVFAEEGEQTPLWLELDVDGDTASVTVFMEDQTGRLIVEPEANRNISLKESELPRFSGKRWQLDGARVDASLLVRQRARWYGTDAFLEKHGGEEFEALAAKQRIRFGEGDNTYHCFVGLGDGLVWKDKRWTPVDFGPQSQGKPLLFLKKIDERMLQFDLWDEEGRTRTSMNLVKTSEMWRFPGTHKIQFVGARTRSQSVLEMDGKRLIVGPEEWILHVDGEGWKILNTIKDIDDYVEGRLTGELFVAEGISKTEGQTLLIGHVFNKTRSQMQMVELSTLGGEIKVYDAEGESVQEQSNQRPGSEERRQAGTRRRSRSEVENGGQPNVNRLQELKDSGFFEGLDGEEIDEEKLLEKLKKLENFRGVQGR